MVPSPGLSPNHLSLPLTELQPAWTPTRLDCSPPGLQPAWTAAREDRLHERRTPSRISKPGAGRHPRLAFTDRVVITLVQLRLAIPHAALAGAYGVFPATVTRAVTQIRRS